MKSWVSVSPESDFSLQNLPYGVFKRHVYDVARIGVAIGDFVVDLKELVGAGLMEDLGFDPACLEESKLNAFMAQDKSAWLATRSRLQQLLSEGNDALASNDVVRARALIPMAEVEMMLPCDIGDYTDFYASRQHATNVGCMFRDPNNALLPNWLHMPVGYHGRASSVVVSGTPIRRPCGQLQRLGALIH